MLSLVLQIHRLDSSRGSLTGVVTPCIYFVARRLTMIGPNPTRVRMMMFEQVFRGSLDLNLKIVWITNCLLIHCGLQIYELWRGQGKRSAIPRHLYLHILFVEGGAKRHFLTIEQNLEIIITEEGVLIVSCIMSFCRHVPLFWAYSLNYKFYALENDIVHSFMNNSIYTNVNILARTFAWYAIDCKLSWIFNYPETEAISIYLYIKCY